MNWGTKVVLGMIGFMLFIVAMVVYMFAVHGNDPLVEENYYEKGINYNMEFDAIKNVTNEHLQPTITVNKYQLTIQLIDSVDYELKMMRPSSEKEDVLLKGSTFGDSNLIVVGTEKMYKGLWFMELKWKKNGKSYLYKKNITL